MAASFIFLSVQWTPIWSDWNVSKSSMLRFSFENQVRDCKKYNFIKDKQELVDLGEVSGRCHVGSYFSQSEKALYSS